MQLRGEGQKESHHTGEERDRKRGTTQEREGKRERT